jgi:predicted nucleic acid-binding protein
MARSPAVAYVDTSYLVAIALGERGAGRLAKRLERYDRLLASNLLEAEFRSALVREQVSNPPDPFLSWVAWVLPDRPLSAELRRIAGAGYLKGADMWHLAHALYLAPDATGLDFLTLDRRQQEAAAALGFPKGAAPSSR